MVGGRGVRKWGSGGLDCKNLEVPQCLCGPDFLNWDRHRTLTLGSPYHVNKAFTHVLNKAWPEWDVLLSSATTEVGDGACDARVL